MFAYSRYLYVCVCMCECVWLVFISFFRRNIFFGFFSLSKHTLFFFHFFFFVNVPSPSVCPHRKHLASIPKSILEKKTFVLKKELRKQNKTKISFLRYSPHICVISRDELLFQLILFFFFSNNLLRLMINHKKLRRRDDSSCI